MSSGQEQRRGRPRGCAAARPDAPLRGNPALLGATSFSGAVSPHFMPNFHERLPVLPNEFMTVSNIPSGKRKTKQV